jgi:chromosome segregation ATPase
MTPSRYYVARFAQAFGYFRKNQRMGDAASEMHLLREAEAHLGAIVWEKVDGIESLSVEYWNLRKFIKEMESVQAKLATCQAKLDKAHEDRAAVMNPIPEINDQLTAQRSEVLTELETLVRRRDDIVIEAREVRRTYDGLRMKLEVLTQEKAPPDQIEQVKSRLAALKSEFAGLKQRRIDIGHEIEVSDGKVDAVSMQLSEKKNDRRAHAAEAFQVIGDVNKEISVLRAESGALEIQMRQLYSEIGRFVSRYAAQDPACAAAVSSHRGMVEVMHALRNSIALNHRLAGAA